MFTTEYTGQGSSPGPDNIVRRKHVVFTTDETAGVLTILSSPHGSTKFEAQALSIGGATVGICKSTLCPSRTTLLSFN